MPTDLNMRWKAADHVRSTLNDDGGVLLDIKKGLCYSLNVVGAKIWEQIESTKEGKTFAAIMDALGSQFSVPPKQLESDIEEYLHQLERIGLIQSNGYV